MDVKIPKSFFLSLKERGGDNFPKLLAKTLEEAFEREENELSLSFLDLILSKKENDQLNRLDKAKDLLKFFNEIAEKKFKPISANLKLISSLLSDYNEIEIRGVIINKTEQWKGHWDLEKYLRPSTIFRRSNFDGYVNEPLSPRAFENKFKQELDALLERQDESN